MISRSTFLLLVLAALLLTPGVAMARANEAVEPPLDLACKGGTPACVAIKSGTLHAPNGDLVALGYDKWGFNYQAHAFDGLACHTDRDGGDCAYYGGVQLSMKWNDAYLSNQDCDGDGYLDYHFGFAGFKGSGGWVTNHYKGTYPGANGQVCRWSELYKFVAVPADARYSNGVWYAADGRAIGPAPAFNRELALVLDVYNDPCGGYHGLYYHSAIKSGLGPW